jgi:ethanolamine utilization cobalamin adenosyltransferase
MTPQPNPSQGAELNELLDNYYTPIKLPDNNREGLVAALLARERRLVREAVKQALAVNAISKILTDNPDIINALRENGYTIDEDALAQLQAEGEA